MGINTGYTGILQVIETIKIILGLNKKCKNYLLFYNIINNQKQTKKIHPTRNRIAYNNNNAIKNIKFICNHNIIYKEHLIIDLRKKSEFTKKHIKKSINIPLLNLKIDKTIKLIQKYYKEKEIVLYCNENTKSILGYYILKDNSITNIILDSNS